MKASQYATNPKSKDGFVDKAVYAESALNATNAEKSNSAIKVDLAELSDGTKLLTKIQADNDT